MILGFGKVEADTARKILKECYDAINKDRDKPAKDIVAAVQEVHKKQGEEYGKKPASEVPERYSYFWASASGDFFRFKFHHINRRHPMSRDGWALFETTWVLDKVTGKTFREA